MMKRGQLAAVLAIATVLSSASLFADQRHDKRTDRGDRRVSNRNAVTLEGRIRDIDRDRNGFVIRLDRGNYRVFAAGNADVRTVSNRGRRGVRQLGRGDIIRVRGYVASRNMIHAQSIDLVRDQNARVAATLEGVVESVDRYRGVLWLREDRTRRTIAVELDRNELRQTGYGYDFDDIRRGDRIVLRGEWQNGGFAAYDVGRQARRW